MKRFLTFAFCLMAATLFAANPAFTDFNSNQFGTSGNKVVIKSGTLLTNPVVNSGVITGNGAGLTNLNIPASSVTNLGTAAYSNSASFQNASAILSNVVSGASNSYVGSFTGNGSGLTNLNLTNAVASGLTLYGVTTNGSVTGSNWVGGFSMWNPNTGKTVVLTNGSIATTSGITDTQNGVSTVISSNAITTGSGTFSTGTTNLGVGFYAPGSGSFGNGYFFTNSGGLSGLGAKVDGTEVVLQTLGTSQIRLGTGGNSWNGSLRFGGSAASPSVRFINQNSRIELDNTVSGGLTNLAVRNIDASGTITATNGVFGASGTLSCTTQAVISVVASTYTNILFSTADYSKVFGGITASTDGALTNAVAGNYMIHIGCSFSGAGGTTLYEGAVFTNGVECTIVEWERDVSSSSTGNANVMAIVTLPANCRVDFRVKNGGTESATFKKILLNVFGAN